MSDLILSIDTSCDDTSAAVVCGREIWSNVIASQTDLHRPYGGVFPTVAKQAHKENIAPTVKMALKRAGVTIEQISKIAVTIGPGLAPALEVGIDFAKQLAEQYHLPLIPVNHIEGHVLSVLAKPRPKSNRQPGSSAHYADLSCRHSGLDPESQNLIDLRLPALSIIVSGGHTQFILVEPRITKNVSHSGLDPESSNLLTRHAELTSDSEVTLNSFQGPRGKHSQEHSASRTVSLGTKKAINQPETSSHSPTSLDRQPRLSLAPDPLDPHRPWLNSGQFTYTILGQTLDDAAGECLDKVGRMLNLGYPAAPVMEQLAKLGDPNHYTFPLPMTTSHDYHLSFAGLKTHARRLIESEFGNQPPTKQQTYDFCASFQTAVFRHITHKLSKILADYPQIQEVWLGGGVAANMALRKSIRQTLTHFTRHAELTSDSEVTLNSFQGPIGKHSKENSASRTESLGTQIANNPSPLNFRTPYTKRLCQDNAGMGGVTVSP